MDAGELVASNFALLLRSDRGVATLRYLRSVYHGSHDISLERETVRSLYDAKLLTGPEARPRLTPDGYLVGNVAKEHCNWLDNGRQLPDPKPQPNELQGKDVLDLGCSYGRWLWYFQEHARSVTGIEQQSAYVALGAALAELSGYKTPTTIVGNVDDLRQLVGQRKYDFVFSRLVLNYVRVRDVLQTVAGILRPGGTIWLQVERVRILYPRFMQRPSKRWLLDSAFATFGIINTMLFNVAGVQSRIPHRGRMHSYHQPVFPSVGVWNRELRRVGFGDLVLIDTSPSTFSFKAILK